MKNHMMIDLETLGVSRDCVILSAGLVVFDKESLIALAHMYLDPSTQPHRSIDPHTVRWWLHKNRSYFAGLCSKGVCLLSDLREMILKLYNENLVERVWSRGSFDMQILRDAIGVPWEYYRERDVRTLDELGISKMKKNSHSAIEDAINQAEYVQEVLRCSVRTK